MRMLDLVKETLSLGLYSPALDPDAKKSLRDMTFAGASYPIGTGAVGVTRTDIGPQTGRLFKKQNVRTLRNYAEFCPFVRAAIDIYRDTIEKAEWRLNPADRERPMNATV